VYLHQVLEFPSLSVQESFIKARRKMKTDGETAKEPEEDEVVRPGCREKQRKFVFKN
jgi:hypothetical protein